MKPEEKARRTEACPADGTVMRLWIIWGAASVAMLILLLRECYFSLPFEPVPFLPYVFYSIAAASMPALAKGRQTRGAAAVLEPVLLLLGIGIAMQYRMESFHGAGSVMRILPFPAGLAAMYLACVLFSGKRWAALEKTAIWAYLAMIAVFLAMLAFGRRYRGGIFLPGMINPTEFAKPLMVIFLASFLSSRKKDFSRGYALLPLPKPRALLQLAAFLAPPAAMVFLLRDFGLLLLMGTVAVFMLYFLTKKAGYLLFGAGGTVLAFVAISAFSAHVGARLSAFLDPFSDPAGTGWQILQSLSAMNAGGLWGAGLGAGKPEAVPIVSTDFAYAAISEEMGLVAALFTLLLYCKIFVCGFCASEKNKSGFGSLLACGLTSILAFQALFNIAGVTKSLPLTGIVLPFLSYGGSALIAMLAVSGLLAALVADSGN